MPKGREKQGASLAFSDDFDDNVEFIGVSEPSNLCGNTITSCDAVIFDNESTGTFPQQSTTPLLSDSTPSTSCVATPSSSRSSTPALSPEEFSADRRKRKCNSADDKLVSIIKSSLKDQDTLVNWGSSVGAQLKQTDKVQCSIAKKIINDVVFYAELGLLTPSACITNLKQFE